MPDAQKNVSHSARILGLWTTLSRLLGYLRDTASASLFGAGWVSDTYIYAFRIPNLLRDLLAEGALSSAFVPAMSKEKERHGKAAALELIDGMGSSLGFVVGLLVLAGFAAAPALVGLLAPGFHDRPEQFTLTVTLTRILLPFIAFMAFGALAMGALNSLGRFLPGAIAPSFLNLTLILAWAGLALFPPLGGKLESVKIWAWATLAGGFLQMAVQLPSLWREGFRPRLRRPFASAKVRAVWAQMGPAVLASSTTQINLVVNSVLASFLAAGSATYLYYGNRLMQLPLGIFGVSIATALLPSLARDHAAGDSEAFRKNLGFGLRLTLFITLPASLGLIFLSEPINILLFKGGAFDLQAAQSSARASVVYSAGIVFAALIKVLSPAFYARESGATAAKVSLSMVGLNLILNLALLRPLGYLGLALSTTLCGLVQAALLAWLMRAKIGPMIRSEVLAGFPKVLASLAAMLGLLLMARAWLDRGLDEAQLLSRSRLAWELPLLIGLSCLAYFSAARFLGLDLWRAILGKKAQKA